MKGLGVTSPVRTPLAPEIPAIAEMFRVSNPHLVRIGGTRWNAARRGDEAPRCRRGNPRQARRESPARRSWPRGAPMAPEEFADFIKREIAKWTREVRDSGIEPE